ncbi:ArnT family glycosyltransferase [Coprobacter tertius]|uniref:Glycosyltransferase family 39 protein n=1 Tax=Coprobacter tertius TaxID=2944915 RepID=A0ABT1MEK4_9BACT|nr:glycosyltransferase family 39 protein [Coprobacter tertius]MCP9611058.1 glycosyltransferase family 39 protein [Coprobacter tertius]
MRLNSKATLFILVFSVSVLTLLPFLGLTDFHTKGEPREAIVSVSMIQTDNWVLPENNGGDIAYKPPMFHWIAAALSMPYGTVTEFSSRLPSALATIILALCCFMFFAKRTTNNLAFLTTLLFLSAFEVHRAAMAARVDMVLTLFIVTALFQLFKWTEKGLRGFPLIATLLMGAATLTKGPVGIILPCLVSGIYLLIKREKFLRICLKFIPVVIVSCILPGIWYYLAWKQGGDNFINLVIEENFGRFMGKMSYESHEQSIFYYIYTTLAGFIPWSILVVISLFSFRPKKIKGKPTEWWNYFKNYIKTMDSVRLFSLLSFAVIFVFYCIPKSKRSVYLLPVYPFLAYFLAEYMLWLIQNRSKVWKIFGAFLSILTSLVILIFITLKTGWINPDILPAKYSALASHYITALQTPWNIGSILSLIVLIIVLYHVYKNKRDLTINNRYLYTIVALFFWLQILLDAFILPGILNAKSMRPFAEQVKETVPTGNIYSYVSAPMMHFFIVNFYNDNRVIDFEKENRPETGFLLVGKHDFNFIQEEYGKKYHFEPILISERKGNDVKDIIYLYKFTEIK